MYDVPGVLYFLLVPFLITYSIFCPLLVQGVLVLGSTGWAVAWCHCQCQCYLVACGGMGSAMHFGWDLVAGWRRVVAMLKDRTGDGFEEISARWHDWWHRSGALGCTPAALWGSQS